MCDIVEQGQMGPLVTNKYIPRSTVPSLALVAGVFGFAGGARVPAGGRDLRTSEAILGALISRYAVSVQIFTVLIAAAGQV